jgi:heme oxygenase
MGTFAKRLGQIATKSLQTEGATILKTSAANKVPNSLALALDGTLHQGHDMKLFGLGTAASMATRARYGRFTRSMHAVYATMEQELDSTARTNDTVALLWDKHGPMLRREAHLRADLADVDVTPELDAAISSAATAAYVERIRMAGAADRDGGSARLLGHVYCRYFADLFGGQMLGKPTAAALDLPAGTPRHYSFDFGELGGRKSAIEAVYCSLNEAGALLPEDGAGAVVGEALGAFEANALVYGEEQPLWPDAARGALNVVVGFATGRGEKEKAAA